MREKVVGGGGGGGGVGGGPPTKKKKKKLIKKKFFFIFFFINNNSILILTRLLVTVFHIKKYSYKRFLFYFCYICGGGGWRVFAQNPPPKKYTELISMKYSVFFFVSCNLRGKG